MYVLPPSAQQLESGQTMLIVLGMVLVLAILVGLSKRRNRREHFPSGEISFILLVFLALLLIGKL
jgi:LPXTG-motif cell wall-anchored protein